MNKAVSHSRRLILCLLGLAALSGLSAQTPAPSAKGRLIGTPLPGNALEGFSLILDSTQRQSLLSNGELTRFSKGSSPSALCPVPDMKAVIDQTVAAVKPSIGIESLVIMAMPANLVDRPDRDLVMFNLLHRFRTMEGIQYWSESRKTMRVFFTSSHLVTGVGNRTPLPDPQFAGLEAEHAYLLEQEDSSFGKNLYQIEVRSLPSGGLSLHMRNLDQVWYGIVPVLSPRSLDMHIIIQPSADGKFICLYGNAGVNAPRALGLEERAQSSYHNRILALFSWFAQAMAGVGPA